MKEPSRVGGHEEISWDAFEEICRGFPAIREIREKEKTVPDSRFEYFLHFFQKLRQINYEPSSEKRYKYLFGIVEMGNCIDKMGESIKGHKFFSEVKHYRNVSADGFHAFSPEMADRLIHSFIHLLRTQNDQGNLAIFKDSFQRVARGENTYSFLIEGGPAEQKAKVVKLLSQMKYFFEKAKLFAEQGNLNAASMAFIGGANCARDFGRFYCEKEKRARGIQKLEIRECKDLFSDERTLYIRDMLVEIENLLGIRQNQFAHQNVLDQKRMREEFLTKTFLVSYQKLFVEELYSKASIYLQKELGAELLEFGENSPRAYESEKVKKRAPVQNEREREQLLAQVEKEGRAERNREDRAGEEERKRQDQRREERRREQEREDRYREERRRDEERRAEERRREERRNEGRRRDERSERKDRRDDREYDEKRRHYSPGRGSRK